VTKGRDAAATILALGLALALNIVAVGLVTAALMGKPVIEGTANVLAGIVGLVGGILASYLGFRVGHSIPDS
jgi:hypothetical protein